MKPNILIIMSDQHNKHVCGCYGDAIVRTPHIDRLAREGMRFDAAYCPAPLCVPSRMSFMTGRLPCHNRVWINRHILSSAVPTWAHYLGAAGYETALIGRMHFTGPDQLHGFEKRPLGEFCARHPGAPEAGGPTCSKYEKAVYAQNRHAVEISGYGTTVEQWAADRVAEEACKYLRERAAAPSDKPFAAVAGFFLPHSPYIAPKELFDYYYTRITIPKSDERMPASTRRLREKRGFMDIDAERIRKTRAAYYALCERTDAITGRILDVLDETGLSENTLVLYTSDHGDMAGEHGIWGKSNFYEGSAGIPLLARLPGRIPAGSVSDMPVCLTDLGPTFCEVAGAAPMLRADGRSLLSVMEGGSPDMDRTVISELMNMQFENSDYPARMIRQGPWKLWAYAGSDPLPPALFHLADDPGECTDLAGDDRYAGVVSRLMAELYKDWNPLDLQRESQQAAEDVLVLHAWGQAVKPSCPCTLPYPGPALESDVVLL